MTPIDDSKSYVNFTASNSMKFLAISFLLLAIFFSLFWYLMRINIIQWLYCIQIHCGVLSVGVYVCVCVCMKWLCNVVRCSLFLLAGLWIDTSNCALHIIDKIWIGSFPYYSSNSIEMSLAKQQQQHQNRISNKFIIIQCSQDLFSFCYELIDWTMNIVWWDATHSHIYINQ